MRLRFLVLAALLCTLPVANAAFTPVDMQKTVYNFSLVSLDGQSVSLAQYKGKVLLIVNLASQSVYSNQLAELEQLQKTYSEMGLVVLGIPSADFGKQELSTPPALKTYYEGKVHGSFPVFANSSVRGKDELPLFHFLTDPKNGAGGGDVHWSFTKFLVDRKGEPVCRVEPSVPPSDPEFRMKVEQVLKGTFKKEAAGKQSDKAAQEDEDEDRP